MSTTLRWKRASLPAAACPSRLQQQKQPQAKELEFNSCQQAKVCAQPILLDRCRVHWGGNAINSPPDDGGRQFHFIFLVFDLILRENHPGNLTFIPEHLWFPLPAPMAGARLHPSWCTNSPLRSCLSWSLSRAPWMGRRCRESVGRTSSTAWSPNVKRDFSKLSWNPSELSQKKRSALG